MENFSKNKLRKERHQRTRSKIQGTNLRPRVSIHKSLKHLYIQLIDDQKQKTILGISDKMLKGKDQKLNPLKKSKILAQLIAQKAKKLGIKKIVFDRSGYAYKGIIKEIAENLRHGGLKF